MKTAQEMVPTRYVKDGYTSTPEPAFRRSWSRLRKLQWQASLIMWENPGVRLYVFKGKSWTNSVFEYGLFQISFNNGGMSAVDYQTAGATLNGISTGLSIAESINHD